MCSRAIAASWWNTKNTGAAGRCPEAAREGSGLHFANAGLPVCQNVLPAWANLGP